VSALLTPCRPALGPAPQSVPDLVIRLATVGGVDAVGAPGWLADRALDHLSRQPGASRWRLGAEVIGADRWRWWFVPPGSDMAFGGVGAGCSWPPPSRYLRHHPRPDEGSTQDLSWMIPSSAGAALCTHPILLSCTINAACSHDPGTVAMTVASQRGGPKQVPSSPC
jgi:hypothetical protein